MINFFRFITKELFNLVFILIIIASSLFAKEDSTFTVTIPRIDGSVKIDGILDDSFWIEAASIQNFYTFHPLDGQPADEKTAVLLGYTSSALYIAFICFDSTPII